MSLIQQLKQAQDFTEREKDIARFVLEHPETIENMSSRELGPLPHPASGWPPC